MSWKQPYNRRVALAEAGAMNDLEEEAILQNEMLERAGAAFFADVTRRYAAPRHLM
jgi:hypothetical protein